MSAVLKNFPGRFRAMGHFDLEEVMAIETKAYAFPWTEGIIRDCLRIGYRCRVLEVQGRIEAYGILSVSAGEAHILNLCVRPESCGQGLARSMLSHLLDVARINNAMTVFLEVRPSNPRALLLYRKTGFCEVGIRKGYYPALAGREDAMVMAKEI